MEISLKTSSLFKMLWEEKMQKDVVLSSICPFYFQIVFMIFLIIISVSCYSILLVLLSNTAVTASKKRAWQRRTVVPRCVVVPDIGLRALGIG